MSGLRDQVSATGAVKMVLRGPDGKVKEAREEKNLVVAVGRAYIASRMTGTGQPVMSHMGVGSSTTAASASQTALLSALGARVVLSAVTIVGGDNHQVRYTCVFAPGQGTGSVTEAGVFNDSTAGVMLCRTVFPLVTKGVDDTLELQWTVTLNA
jgi:hypothetical protein